VVGNSFTQVSPTNVSLTLTNDATLTWNWQTQYQLTTETNGNGSVTAADGWYAEGSNKVLTATNDLNWHFSRWDGDTNGCVLASNTITAPMTQARTIRAVFEIDQKTLTVVSAHGGESPGTLTTNYNTALSLWVTNSPVSDGVSTQYLCQGWTMLGNEPASGLGTNVTLTLTNDATLTWQWATQFNLTVSAGPHGSVICSNGWYDAGSITSATAVPSNGWYFAGWWGDVHEAKTNDTPLTLTMDQARSLSANFGILPIPLIIEQVGNQVVLSWTNAAFSLQCAPDITGVFTNIPTATNPWTNPITGDQQYFRLIAN